MKCANNNAEITAISVNSYFKILVNRFFKILPMKESNEITLPTYIQSLQLEIIGCGNFIQAMTNDPNIIILSSILQYMLDTPDMSVKETKREVFRAIAICNKLKSLYGEE